MSRFNRVVLLGYQGGDAAGKVIQSFGEVVIGGYAVGLVVLILSLSTLVVTKGAGRISVSARFLMQCWNQMAMPT